MLGAYRTLGLTPILTKKAAIAPLNPCICFDICHPAVQPAKPYVTKGAATLTALAEIITSFKAIAVVAKVPPPGASWGAGRGSGGGGVLPESAAIPSGSIIMIGLFSA